MLKPYYKREYVSINGNDPIMMHDPVLVLRDDKAEPEDVAYMNFDSAYQFVDENIPSSLVFTLKTMFKHRKRIWSREEWDGKATIYTEKNFVSLHYWETYTLAQVSINDLMSFDVRLVDRYLKENGLSLSIGKNNS